VQQRQVLAGLAGAGGTTLAAIIQYPPFRSLVRIDT